MMNYIEQIFHRCNLETLCEFLMHGSEPFKTSKDGHYERARNAEDRLSEWLQGQFPGREEYEKHFSLVYSVVGEMQSIYMQIGLQAGILLAAEFYEKRTK